MFTLGRGTINSAENSSRYEWLVTNGIGGFASGTISGVLTRRYHGLLVAALNQPLGRTLLVSKLDETATYGDQAYPLYTNSWSPDSFFSDGHKLLDSFQLDGTTPVWRYAIADALLEKRVWMQQGANTTYVSYTLLHGSAPLTLNAKTILNYRDYHGVTRANNFEMGHAIVNNGLALTAFDGATPYYLLSNSATISTANSWYRNYHLAIEAYRGESDREDHLYGADFVTTLEAGMTATFVLTTEADAILDGNVAWAAQKAHDRRIIESARISGENSAETNPHTDSVSDKDYAAHIEHLLLSADQFIVTRATDSDTDGRTVIAGYPWFGDWGRDTMIALPGLALATGRYNVAEKILQTFARFVDQGMLPNRFPDYDEDPEYNTVDATLWYFEAIRAYYNKTGDFEMVRELFPVLQRIIEAHKNGTRYSIHMDSADGLLYAGQEGVQLTWMDAKVDNWVVTPRIGKAVEINALWYNALCIMHEFAQLLGEDADYFNALSAKVARGFDKFWNSESDCLFDVIGGPEGFDASIRPNQLFAVSLHHSPLTGLRQKSVVDTCARHLLTPHGLRSLAPMDSRYSGVYGGDRYQRDGAYHQGPVWGWLIGAFAVAHQRVYNSPAQARSYLKPLLNHMEDAACIGSMNEIFDGDAPFTPRGCPAQAWTVAEVLRAWEATAPVVAATTSKRKLIARDTDVPGYHTLSSSS